MRLQPRILLILSFAALISFTACKDKEAPPQKSAAGVSGPMQAAARPALSTEPQTGQSVGQSSLLSVVPANAGAFFFWDLASPAYERLLTSRWGGSYLSKTQTIAGQMPELASLLKDSGLDIGNPMEFRKKVRQALVVLQQPVPNQTTSIGGLVLRAADASSASQLITAFKGAIEKHGMTSAPAEGGFSFEINAAPAKPLPGQPTLQMTKTKLFAASSGDKIVIGDDQGIVTRLTAASEEGAPTSPAIVKLMSEAPSDQDRVVMGYVDALSLIQDEKQKQETPISAAFLSVKMTDRPTVQFRLQKRPGTAPSTVEAVAPTKELLAAFPAEAILFTTVQAGMIRDMATKSSPDAATMMNDTQFAPLKSVTQIAIGAKGAPAGQAMLPIPELIISVLTSQPKQFSDEVVNSAQAAVKGYGLPGQLSEKTIAGHKVQVLPGAFGVSLLVAQLDNAVLASTSEGLMQDALTRVALPDPLTGSGLSAAAIQSVRTAGLGRLYVSFPEVVKMLASAKDLAGPMMSAKGPNGAPNPAAEMLSPDNLKAIGDMGTLLGSMVDQGDEFRAEITYL